MNKREIPCGAKECKYHDIKKPFNCTGHVFTSYNRCGLYRPDPTELAIQIQDNGGNGPLKNGGDE